MSLEGEPVTPSIGASGTGVSLAAASEDELTEVLTAIAEHKVLFFPGQALDPEAHLAFARRLGPLDVAAFGPKHADHPEMTVLDQQAPKGEGADAWHTDTTYVKEPPSYTVLQAVQLPELCK